MSGDFWSKTYVLSRVSHYDLVSLGLFVDQKPGVDVVTNAFKVLIVFRVLGVDLAANGGTTVDPIKIGDVNVPLQGNLGTLEGQFTYWEALDEHQKPVANPTFANSASVAFTLVGKAAITLILASLPVPVPIKLILAVVQKLIGPKVTVTIGQIHETIPLHKS
jgi:hypothetical protein